MTLTMSEAFDPSLGPEYAERKKPWDLLITLTRHGPKEGSAGPLTLAGREVTSIHFGEAYEGVPTQTTEIVHSGKDRARETAELYASAVDTGGVPITADERVSEGDIAEEPDFRQRLGGGRGHWLRGWLDLAERDLPNVKTGQEALADLSEWILEKIDNAKAKGGDREIDAFSHGPVLAALLFAVQGRVGEEFLPADWEDRDIFWNLLPYLSTLTLHSSAERSEIITLQFKGKCTKVPRSLFEEWANLKE